MGSINIDNTGSGGAITLSSDGTSLLLGGSAVGGGADLYAANESSPSAQPSATGANAVAIGDSAVASGSKSIALGYKATATANFATAFAESRAAGEYSFAAGIANDSTTYGASAAYSISIGYQSRAKAGQSVALGSTAYVDSDSNRGLSLGENAYVEQMDYGSAIGANARVHGSNSTTHATAIGTSYASGNHSFAAAIANNSSSYGASGANSIAMGYQNKADDPNAVAIGKSNISSGAQTSIAIGMNNSVTGMRGVAIGSDNTVGGLVGHAYGANHTVSGQYAVALNRDNDAASNYSFVSGYYADSHAVKGRFARGTGGLSLNGTKGDAQYGLLVLVKNTTDATQTALSTDTLTAGNDNQLVVQNNGAVAFHGTIVAKQAGSSNIAAWEVKGLMHNVTTATLVNSAITVIDNTPSWGFAMAADTTNDAVQFLVTGAASTNISWVATIHSSEVIRS